jgi:predicted esterase YcpF (UPF0227 family)
MKVLFLHGKESGPGGTKAKFLVERGFMVINPALPKDDFEASIRIAQAAFDEHNPTVVVGSSRGGAVAMNINSGNAGLVLLAPAWRKWGSAKTIKSQTRVIHSRQDEIIPFADSEVLVASSPNTVLVEIGDDHRLSTSEPLTAMLEAVRKVSAHLPSSDAVVPKIAKRGVQLSIEFDEPNPAPKSTAPSLGRSGGIFKEKGVHYLEEDDTVRFSARSGDFLFWIGTDSFLAAHQFSAWTVRDFWQMRDGDSITITNRWDDVPSWFTLQPTEVSGSATYKFTKAMLANYKPDQETRGPNIWRVKSGNRLVLLRADDILKNTRTIINFRACSLVIGETEPEKVVYGSDFGAVEKERLTPALRVALHAGAMAAFNLGAPSRWSESWSFGG